MRREAPSSRTSLPSDPSSDSTACMPGCRHDRAPSRGQSRKPVRPSGMTKPSAWRAFLRPAAYRTFWNAPRVEKGRTAPKHPPFLMEDRGKLLKVRNGIRLPWRSIPKPEHHGPHVRQDGLPLPPARNSHETGRLPGSSRASSRVVRVPAPPTLPSLPVSPKRPSSARIASRSAACHAASLIKAYARRDPPLHRRKVPSRLSRAIPAPRKQARERKRERERKKENTPPPSLPSIPLLSGRMSCLISNSRQTATGTFAPT